MKTIIYIACGLFGFSLTSSAQVLLQEEQSLLDEFSWIFKTDVKHACKTSPDAAVEIRETDITTCRFVDAFKMYPNPASDMIRVKFKASKRATSIFISSIDGKLMHSEKLTDFSGEYNAQLNVSNFPKGIHVLTIVQENESFIKKLVIE